MADTTELSERKTLAISQTVLPTGAAVLLTRDDRVSAEQKR